jgi:hypothetical protein
VLAVKPVKETLGVSVGVEAEAFDPYEIEVPYERVLLTN